MVLPAYLFSSGFGSKLSMWLVPPIMKSQITVLALGLKWGLPSGGRHAPASSFSPAEAFAVEHRAQGEPGESHSRVGQKRASGDIAKARVVVRHGSSLSDRDEIVVVEEHVDESLARRRTAAKES